MSEQTTGSPQCTCRDSLTGGKPWCPIHDDFAGRPDVIERRSGIDRRAPTVDDLPLTYVHGVGLATRDQLFGGEPQAAFTKCGGCNRPYSDPGFMDLIVPDDVWAQISPTGDEGGMLCPGCIISAMIDTDQTGEVVFRSGPLNGQRLTIHSR